MVALRRSVTRVVPTLAFVFSLLMFALLICGLLSAAVSIGRDVRATRRMLAEVDTTKVVTYAANIIDGLLHERLLAWRVSLSVCTTRRMRISQRLIYMA